MYYFLLMMMVGLLPVAIPVILVHALIDNCGIKIGIIGKIILYVIGLCISAYILINKKGESERKKVNENLDKLLDKIKE